jgi:hypothetical protein
LKLKNVLLNQILYFFVAILLFYFSAFRESGIDRDYDVYVSAFEGNDLSTTIYEPSFSFITFIINKFLRGDVKFLFIIYALLGVFLKLYAIKKISKFEFISLLLYFSYYFSLHELTQIRVGVSCSLLLFSIPYLYRRDFKAFIFIAIFAFLFHFSAIVIFPLWFLNVNSFNKSRWLLIVFLSIIFGMFFKSFFSNLFDSYSLGFFEQKILSYNIVNNTIYNVFNIWVLFKLFILLIIVCKIERISQFNKYIFLLVKIHIISISFYYLFAFNPTFSGRISDLLGISEIVVFSNLIFIFKPRYLGRIIIVLYSASLLFLNLFYNKIIS